METQPTLQKNALKIPIKFFSENAQYNIGIWGKLMLVWGITVLSLKVPKWAEWNTVFLWQNTDKRSRRAFSICTSSSAMPSSSPFHEVQVSQ